MKLKLLIMTAVLTGIVVFTGCSTSSSSAVMKIESMTENGWEMSVDTLNGTDTVNLNSVTDEEAYTAEVAVGVTKGTVTIGFKNGSGEMVYTSEPFTQSGMFTAELDGDSYRMVLTAEDFGGTVEVAVTK